jgi:hypothetical protein
MKVRTTLRSRGLALQPGQPDQIGHPRIDAALSEERRKLPAVMRLVIEEVRDSYPQRQNPRLGIYDARVG